MAKQKLQVNYSIENIAQSIVRDHPINKKYSAQDKQKLYQEKLQLLDSFPEIKKIVSLEHIRKFRIPAAKRITRLGILPPEIIVVDSRIQDMCSLPFWTFYGSGEGSFGRCAGVGNFSCCPPFSLKAEKVQALLDKSDIFLVLQTKPSVMGNTGNPGGQFQMINRLTDDINGFLGRKSVMQKFAGGPCFACYPEMCIGEGKCRAPGLKVPSLEGMGICVDQMCKDLAILTGDENWRITWIKGFGADTQTPRTFKGTLGLAISLKENKEQNSIS